LQGRDDVRWEYRIVHVVDSKVEERDSTALEMCNRLGEQEWELVGAVPREATAYRLFFKRPKVRPAATAEQATGK
jgi:hypothetical protein